MKLRAMYAAGLFCASIAQAAPVTLNFDGAVDTDITNDFAGLTFLAPSIGSPVRTWAAGASADTPSNVLGLTGSNNFFALNQADGTAIDIVFATAVSSVSIRAAFVQASDAFLGVNDMLPFMAVYNSSSITAANRIALDTWNIAADSCLNSGGAFCQSGYDTLSFTSSSANIKAIRITGAAGTDGDSRRRSIFDTLTYDQGNDNGGGGTVPEPGTLALLGLAIAGLGFSRRLKLA